MPPLQDGEYRYKMTYLSAQGETEPVPILDVDAQAFQAAIQRVDGELQTLGRRIYRTEIGGSVFRLHTGGEAPARAGTDHWEPRSTPVEAVGVLPRRGTRLITFEDE